MAEHNISGTTRDSFELGDGGPIFSRKPGTDELILPLYTQGAVVPDDIQSSDTITIPARRQMVVLDELIVEGELFVDGNLIVEG